MAYTQEILAAGGFSLTWSKKLGADISVLDADDPGCWGDIRAALERVRDGTCRWDEWSAPLDRKNVDLGEIRARREDRLYRLYVRADRATPMELILLHFAWKPFGKEGLEPQDDQIDEAFNRFMEMQQ
ncbi:hypothetical protein DSM43518_04577 [Mycobacterium marinum]|uniref:hypothetical protein n=1 Tax=Mycobacterium marinum TaxID=1781 RepID=UPI000E3D85A1|nr:hypothetical protein [Mycobacterium marinum]RFZ03862.1 hypothetical protein DSM43518_04577 [Mycobacterium marinum]